MQTDSSASRTWRLSRSASLNTATVEMRSSRQARMTRSAISPRLAIRTLRNTGSGSLVDPVGRAGHRTLAVAALALHRLPGAVGGRRDALELEAELVGVVAVLERLFLGDEAVAQQRHDRLVEGLHAVLGDALGDRGVDRRDLLRVEDVLADGRRAHHDLDRGRAPGAVAPRD